MVDVPMEDNNNNSNNPLAETEKLLTTTTTSTSSSASSNAATAAYKELLKLVFGAGGIYAAFLYYGSLQEDVFRYTAADGVTQFKQAWF